MLKNGKNFENLTGTYIEADLIRSYNGAIKTANEDRQALADSEYLMSFGTIEEMVRMEQRAVVVGQFLANFQYEFKDHGDVRRALLDAVLNGTRQASYGGESTSNGQRLIDFFNRKAWMDIITDREIVKAVSGGKISMVDGDPMPAVTPYGDYAAI